MFHQAIEEFVHPAACRRGVTLAAIACVAGACKSRIRFGGDLVG